jgi:hypothetical protein
MFRTDFKILVSCCVFGDGRAVETFIMNGKNVIWAGKVGLWS